MAAVLIDGQPALLVQGQAVGSWLTVLGDVGGVIAALVPEHLQGRAIAVLINRVVIRIAEEQGLLVPQPDRSFGELKAFGELVELRIGRDDCIDPGIVALYVYVHLMWLDRDRCLGAGEKLQLGLTHVDVVGRCVGDGAVHAEDGQLYVLARFHVAAHEQAVCARSSRPRLIRPFVRRSVPISPSTHTSA